MVTELKKRVFFWGEGALGNEIRGILASYPDYSFIDIRGWEGLRDDREGHCLKVLLVQSNELLNNKNRCLYQEAVTPLTVIIVVGDPEPPEDLFAWIEQNGFDYLEMPVNKTKLLLTLNKAYSYLEQQAIIAGIEKERQRYTQELDHLNQIGVALSAERDIDRLLQLILQKSREITIADAGSLYLVEGKTEPSSSEGRTEAGGKIRFKLSQNESLPRAASLEEFTIDINQKSIAGYVALTGQTLNLPDVYHLAPDYPYSFNPSFDRLSGYRTKSMLVVPMINHKDEIIGLVQLINRKDSRDLILSSPELVEERVIPFDNRCEELVCSLTSQAAVALENTTLYRDIQNLFEGFVRASVTAIESRDPATRGHSERVATLTIGLAEQVDRLDTGVYQGVSFSAEELREMRYAALLHDFGKVGVREYVLLKGNKIDDPGIEVIKKRFAYIKKSLEVEHYNKKLYWLLAHKKEDPTKKFSRIEEQLQKEWEELDQYLSFILEANRPSVLEVVGSEKLYGIANKTYRDVTNEERNYLTPPELLNLSISKGSLNNDERKEIESHVIHTYQFLRQIPWTKELRQIPQVAAGHHEWLNGEGYPDHLRMAQIPMQARIMTVCDIFDALTAADRPYKKAVPVTRALDILHSEAEQNHIDQELLKIFIEAKIYQLVKKE